MKVHMYFIGQKQKFGLQKKKKIKASSTFNYEELKAKIQQNINLSVCFSMSQLYTCVLTDLLYLVDLSPVFIHLSFHGLCFQIQKRSVHPLLLSTLPLVYNLNTQGSQLCTDTECSNLCTQPTHTRCEQQFLLGFMQDLIYRNIYCHFTPSLYLPFLNNNTNAKIVSFNGPKK